MCKNKKFRLKKFLSMNLPVIGFCFLIGSIMAAQPGDSLQKAKDLMSRYDYRGAIQVLNNIKEHSKDNDPQAAAVHFLLARAYYEVGSQEPAEENLQRVFEIDIDFEVEEADEYFKDQMERIRRKTYKEYRSEEGFVERRFFGGIVMVKIPVGSFRMGTKSGKAGKDEKPEHEVFLDHYWIGKYEMTLGQYNRFISETKHRELPPWVTSLYSTGYWSPIVGVSWYDAAAYCEWLSRETGRVFRLPTEAQWEKAARGIDSRKHPYPWGKSSPNCERAHYVKCSRRSEKPIAVVLLPAGKSSYGIHNMAGNVWEWCQDWYAAGYYKKSPKINPQGTSRGDKKVLRGGSFNDKESALRAANRIALKPDTKRTNLGFRLCMVEKK